MLKLVSMRLGTVLGMFLSMQVLFAQTSSYQEPFRPQFHFTPPIHWMNDPNGMVYYEGEYHLFYQYNPLGNRWGHMSWGHAVSRDLVHWSHLPLALAEEGDIMIFSGSAVVDWQNTSGFGKDGKPPMVAIYTGHNEMGRNQSQHIAYSNDKGRTWTKYDKNPVLDLKNPDFRDPKVFWYAPESKWVMTVVLAVERKVQFYGSKNLKEWTFLSEFGPQGALGGVWECPDLFELPVDGNPSRTKWVLGVNLGGGSVAGGSGGQYFIGHFDGKNFKSDTKDIEPWRPRGDLIADFESGYGNWKVRGRAFGDGPLAGAHPGQQKVGGFRGKYLVNSYLGTEALTGTLTSPGFIIQRKYINFLIGGGSHWGTRMELWVEGKRVHTARGENSEWLDWQVWDVQAYQGQKAEIKIIDEVESGWGHLLVDHIIQSDEPSFSARHQALWWDYGKDFYAAVTWDGAPRSLEGRPWLAWMNNWQYAQDIPTTPWKSAQTIVRTLSLKTFPEGIRLVQTPISTLKTLRHTPKQIQNLALSNQTKSLKNRGIQGKILEIEVMFSLGTAQEVGVEVHKGGAETTKIGYEVGKGIFTDRTASGVSDFHIDFPKRQYAPYKPHDGKIKLHIFIDASSVEVFADEGRISMTHQIFSKPESTDVAVFAQGGKANVLRMKAWKLRSIW